MPFVCTICGTESTRICSSCTKDTCSNHLCDRCQCCSDCCTCEVRLEERQTVQEAGYSRHSHASEPGEEAAPTVGNEPSTAGNAA